MMGVPFVTVDYDEDNVQDYRGVILKVGGVEVKRANSGDFVTDYKEIINYAIENYPGLPVMGSSSIDHYIYDAKIKIEWDE